MIEIKVKEKNIEKNQEVHFMFICALVVVVSMNMFSLMDLEKKQYSMMTFQNINLKKHLRRM